jgi:hypothetical protein
MTTLFTNSNGSVLKTMNMKAFLLIPVWKGNRHIDYTRVSLLAKEVGDNIKSLDSGYYVIKLLEEDAEGKARYVSYLIDGQHRREVILRNHASELCADDFPMTYIEKVVDTEYDAITYFNQINNTKPMRIEEDSRLIANRYVAALEKGFAKGLIRSKTTRRPYLSADLLREELEKYSKILQRIDPVAFVEKVKLYNMKRLIEMDIEKALGKSIPESYKEKEFTLAENFKWILLVLA